MTTLGLELHGSRTITQDIRMLFDYNYQNPSVCCFLVQIWAIAVFACNKPLRWVPAKFAGNPTHAKNVTTWPPYLVPGLCWPLKHSLGYFQAIPAIGLLFTHKNGCQKVEFDRPGERSPE